MNDLVTSLRSPAVLTLPKISRELNLELWVRGSLSWFMQTQITAVDVNTKENNAIDVNYLPASWSQELEAHLQCTSATMATYLHQLTLAQLDLSPGVRRLVEQGALEKAQLFVLGFCAALNDYYELNLALQTLQGTQQNAWPRLYLLCDLVEAICGHRVSPTEMAQWHWLHSSVLQLHSAGPLALAWVEFNIRDWQWLQGVTAATTVRNEFFSVIQYPGEVYRGAPSNGVNARNGVNTRTAKECSDFAVAIRLEQLQQLHLCGSRGAVMSWVKILAENLNKTPVLSSARCPLHWMNLLCIAHNLFPVVEASGDLPKPNDFSCATDFNCDVTHTPIVVWHVAPLSVADLAELQQYKSVAIHYLPGSLRDERCAAWQRWVPPAQAEEFGRRWLIGPETIPALAASLPLSVWQQPAAELRAAIGQARQQLAPEHLQNLAFLVPNQVAADALVLSPKIHAELEALQVRCEQREQVFSELGAAVVGGGHGGVKALLYGESGTGKTLAALYLAHRLATPVYRLDLGAVLNKYIGETEKNIHQLMLEAAAGDFILLIDEADALFARRGDGDSGGERFANMLTNYLLARIEQHPGIVLMTTNGLGRMDGAFMRRFDRVIEFHSPALDERAQLWQNHLGARSPGEQACVHLASLCDLSGGFIRNAVLAAAAELPVSEQSQLSFTCLLQSVAREYRKSGKPLPPKLLNQLNLAQPDKAVQV